MYVFINCAWPPGLMSSKNDDISDN